MSRKSRLLGLVLFVTIIGLALVRPAVVRLYAQSMTPPAVPPGGFVETTASAAVRAPLSSSVIQSLLPARGPFIFPAPYNTQGVRLTNASDCPGATDCVYSVGYAYWRNVNNHVGSDTMLIFLTLQKSMGGVGPSLFSYNKVTGQTQNLGPLFDASSAFAWATGEGWYFSATQPNALYVNTPGGTTFYRYDVLAHTFQLVFDAAAAFGSDKYIWQLNSSNDDKVHSFTVRQTSTSAMLGCGVYNENTGKFTSIPAVGGFDECQIDKSGRYLLIKENTGYGPTADDDNVIVDLQTNAQTLFMDQAGAPGHSDNGFGYMVGEDNWNSQPGATRLWNLGLPFPAPIEGSAPGQGLLVYNLNDWSTGLGHVTHANATTAVPASQQHACVSNASRTNAPRVNELVCFQLDGSLRSLIVAPNMVDLNASGGGSDDYWKLPKANLDVTGEYLTWTANQGGSRTDAFMVRVPSQLLAGGGTGGGGDTTPPTVSITAPSPGATVSSKVLVLANAADNVAVASVQFMVDGVPAGVPVTAAPYGVQWLSTSSTDGVHTLTAAATDTSNNVSVSAPVAVTVNNSTGTGGTGTAVDAVWTNPVNATATGSSLQKTSGCDGCDDAGAVATQQLSAGDGYVEFTASELSTLREIGLSLGSPGTSMAGITFGLRLQAGAVEVRESGLYESDTTFATGDVFRIAVSGGKVQYSKNGAPFYTSAAAPAYPLTVTASLCNLGATISHVVISGPVSATATTGPAVVWSSLVNATVTGTTIRKSGGCAGCADAGAISVQQISTGDGYVEFTASETNTLRAIGLSNGNPGTTLNDIKFALRLQSGMAEVRESGTYRGNIGFATGDVLRIAVVQGRVKYSKNGTVFYSSKLTPAYPLLVDTSFNDVGATITNAVIVGGSTATKGHR